MNYIITTPHEGFMIGLISGAIIYAILYNVFIENRSIKEEEEFKENKTEAQSGDLYNDTFQNIRSRIHIYNY